MLDFRNKFWYSYIRIFEYMNMRRNYAVKKISR